MAEALGARELVEALQPARGAEFFPLNDLPNDLIVSVFAAVEDPTWVRHTFPLVCRAWNELYLTKDASPLHETLEVDFYKEIERAKAAAATVAAREEEGRRDPVEGAPPPFVVHASRVISWAQRRAGWVRELLLDELAECLRYISFRDFTAEDLGALVAVVGSSLTDISIGSGLGRLLERPFWESLRTSVVPAGLLRSLVVEDIESALLESDVEPLGQLAGSLEELVLQTCYFEDFVERAEEFGLPRFPEPFFALKKLRRLALDGHPRITAIPAGISRLKKLEDLELRDCGLSSLPKELGELSRLTSLTLGANWNLGTALPADEAFPADLGKMKSLRELVLYECGLSAVPSFVGELKSLEDLNLIDNALSSLPKELGDLSGLTRLYLSYNRRLGTTLPADEAFPAELGNMKCLRELELSHCHLRTVPSFVGELKSLESLTLQNNDLSSLAKELGELSRLTSLTLGGNWNLGTALPADEAFLADLGKMKCLRELELSHCRLRTVPSFVGGLESLESLTLRKNDLSSLPKELGELSGLTKLDLSWNESLGNTLPAEEAFPAELGNMKCLRELELSYCSLRTVPAFVGQLKSLGSLALCNNGLSSLPKELSELSGLTKLELKGNYNPGTLPQDEAFPSELKTMKSLRDLSLESCGLSAVPAFLGELESLEVLNLDLNSKLQIDAPLDFLIEGCPRLREVTLIKRPGMDPWTPRSLANLEAFRAKLRAKNPNANVIG